MRSSVVLGLAVAACLLAPVVTSAWTSLPVVDDPLVRMPGTQPDSGTNLEGPNRCLNCHDGYDPAVDIGFHWKGSMMAQAARDFLFWACVAVADLRADMAEGVADAINESGGQAKSYEMDAFNRDSLEGCCDAVYKEFGQVDILVNGVGGNMKGATTSADHSFFD